MRTKFALIGAVAGAIAIIIPVVAFGGVNNAPIDRVWVAASLTPFETSSGNWETVDTVEVSIQGPLATFVLTGEGVAMDYGPGGVFKGENYAAMKVRLKIEDGNVLPPGAMTFANNSGYKNSAVGRLIGNTLTWFYQSGGGTLPIQIQTKSFFTHDLAGFETWNLTVYSTGQTT